jgi:hypothetical protein
VLYELKCIQQEAESDSAGRFHLVHYKVQCLMIIYLFLITYLFIYLFIYSFIHSFIRGDFCSVLLTKYHSVYKIKKKMGVVCSKHGRQELCIGFSGET